MSVTKEAAQRLYEDVSPIGDPKELLLAVREQLTAINPLLDELAERVKGVFRQKDKIWSEGEGIVVHSTAKLILTLIKEAAGMDTESFGEPVYLNLEAAWDEAMTTRIYPEGASEFLMDSVNWNVLREIVPELPTSFEEIQRMDLQVWIERMRVIYLNLDSAYHQLGEEDQKIFTQGAKALRALDIAWRN